MSERTESSRLSLLTDTETAPLLVSTLRNMESRQLLGIADRSLRHLIVPSLPIDADELYERKVPSALAIVPAPIRGNTTTLRRCLSGAERQQHRDRSTDVPQGTVTFLNHAIHVDAPDGVDWLGDRVFEPPAMWALKFHGFEFLCWAYLGYDEPLSCSTVNTVFTRWIDDWCETAETRVGTPSYLRRAWTPHAVSLRILNLSRYCAWNRSSTGLDTVAARIVYRNAAFLSNHVEYDVGGNHLIENGAALVMAGMLFDEAGEQWIDQGVSVLTDAADQFLDDGGHFELSPMYHVITLRRYLTVVDLLRRRGRTVPEALREVAESGTRFLRRLSPPDGRIPLLNDAVFGEAIGLQSCLRYADAVGIDAGPAATTSLPASGYYWLGKGEDRLLVDGAGIGPEHLPGHSHNDQFAVCLWADGERVLTDTGTYEYGPSEKRQYARSVTAHNTVQYDDVEPIAIGGSYLFGRRFDPTVTAGETDGVAYFDGSYSRSNARKTLYSHRRRVYTGEDWWLVWDTVEADESAPVRSRFHVAPELDVESETADDQTRLRIGKTGYDGTAAGLAQVLPIGADRVTVDSSPYYPEFGRERTRRTVTLETEGDTVSFGCLLSTGTHRSATVDHEGQAVAGVAVDGHYYPLPATER